VALDRLGPRVQKDRFLLGALVGRQSGEALADAVLPALATKYGGWEAFKYLARLNLLETDAELSGKKRIPQPAR